MRVLVVCPVHHPWDARVNGREIAALVEAGHDVVQVAPFTAFGVEPAMGVRAVDVPRSQGRRRLASLRAVRKAIRREAKDADVVLLHSPEALLAVVDLKHPCIVWDVHEDTAAAIGMKPWLPSGLAAPARWGVRMSERWAEGHVHLLLAERGYADRFAQQHPLVPNSVTVPEAVPPSGIGRAIYVGSVTKARGAHDLIDLGRLLAESRGVRLDVVGTAGPEVGHAMEQANRDGWLTWHGFVENSAALAMIEGASVGLSLLHDEPNYRHSMPTKLLEYLAHGVPFVSTPLPLAVDLAQRSGGGVIVPFGDARAARDAVIELARDDVRRQGMADSGRAWVRDHANWSNDGAAFVRQLEEWSRRR
jgi:glycosyltransferase involved in cell wall biosynthesis